MAHELILVSQAEYQHDALTIAAIQDLNRAGQPEIDKSIRIFREGVLPLGICRPLGEADRPLADYEGFMFRALSYGTGHHQLAAKVENVMIAHKYGMPVIDVAGPSRSHSGVFSVGSVQGWYKMSADQRDDASLALFAENNRHIIDAVNTLRARQALPGKVRMFGESMGTPVAVSLAPLLSDDHDVLSVAGHAMPPIVAREVYSEMFKRDFIHSGDEPGGIWARLTEGEVPFEPYVTARRMSLTKPVGKWQDTKNIASYLFKDMIGPNKTHFRRNEGFARALSRPVGRFMVDTALARGTPIAFSFGSKDPVARPEDAAEHFDGIVDDNFKMYVYPGDHTLCDSPYVMADLIQHSIC